MVTIIFYTHLNVLVHDWFRLIEVSSGEKILDGDVGRWRENLDTINKQRCVHNRLTPYNVKCSVRLQEIE